MFPISKGGVILAISEKMLDEILNKYPAKVKRNRKKHILVKNP